MAETAFLDTAEGRRIAYHKTEGTGLTVVFLGGLKSDMEGTKAIHLEAWAKARGQAFLRFTIPATAKALASSRRAALATGTRTRSLRSGR